MASGEGAISPQRAQALEAELRRRAESARKTGARGTQYEAIVMGGSAAAFEVAADLVRDAAREGE